MMKIAKIDLVPVSIGYRHRELSARVSRDGVTDVVVRMETDSGLVGWGECCSGADTTSIVAAAAAMVPLVLDQDPRDSELLRNIVFKQGLWDYRLHTGNFAYAGLDMAMNDIAAQACGLPLWRLLGGRREPGPIEYFCYLARDDEGGLIAQCEDALARGYSCFYLKVGLNARDDERMIGIVRRAIGETRKLRIDANEAWTEPEALKLVSRWQEAYDLDFVEAPIRAHPLRAMAQFRQRFPAALCANEGMDGEVNVLEAISQRAADVLCFSSYWVGSLRAFVTLANCAGLAGIKVCKHTHGEFGIAAAAHQHALLAIGNGVAGHQQTASIMGDDILSHPVPIAETPFWQADEAPGLGIKVDVDKLDFYHRAYREHGQFLPWAGAS